MRILVVNPNTTGSMIGEISAGAQAVAAAGSEIVAVSPEIGPTSIEGYYDDAMALPGLIEVDPRTPEADGVVVTCFNDPGVDALRTMTAAPVIGIAEASIVTAGLVATRFSIVTTLERAVPRIEELVRRQGAEHRWRRVRAAQFPVLALEKAGSKAADILAAEIARSIEEDRAGAIVLGCAGMTDLAAGLTQRFGRPVIDGIAAGVKLVEALVGLSVRTSKVGGYTPALPKTYAGALAGCSPST